MVEKIKHRNIFLSGLRNRIVELDIMLQRTLFHRIEDFFKWVNGTELVELDSIDVTEDPVRPELTLDWRLRNS